MAELAQRPGPVGFDHQADQAQQDSGNKKAEHQKRQRIGIGHAYLGRDKAGAI